MTTEPDKKPNAFIFQVEIMVEERHHTTALEKLIKEMNRSEWTDYRIISGMQLGRLIEERIEQSSSKINIPLSIENPANPAAPVDNAMESAGVEQIRGFIKKNSLIRLIVNKGFGNTINIPCRIINMDEKEQIVTVYHVDEKQVYTFRLNEIEDFIV